MPKGVRVEPPFPSEYTHPPTRHVIVSAETHRVLRVAAARKDTSIKNVADEAVLAGAKALNWSDQ